MDQPSTDLGWFTVSKEAFVTVRRRDSRCSNATRRGKRREDVIPRRSVGTRNVDLFNLEFVWGPTQLFAAAKRRATSSQFTVFHQALI